jgi:hypothetical protein
MSLVPSQDQSSSKPTELSRQSVTTATTATTDHTIKANGDHSDTKNPDNTEAALSSLLGAFTDGNHNHMERGAPEYSQSGLKTSYPSGLDDASEPLPADNTSAANYPSQEVRPANYSTSATPTSEYSVHQPSARSGSFPEHIPRQYYPSGNHSGSSGNMAQPTSPSLPLQDNAPTHHAPHMKSDQDVPIDPSIAASSPTYPPHGGPYSAYPPQQEMSHGYPQHPGGPMYAQPRPEWAGYSQHPQHGMPAPYPTSGVNAPNSAAPSGPRPGQVSCQPLFITFGSVLHRDAIVMKMRGQRRVRRICCCSTNASLAHSDTSKYIEKEYELAFWPVFEYLWQLPGWARQKSLLFYWIN